MPVHTPMEDLVLLQVKDVIRLARVSYRQLQYWCKTGFIKPACRLGGKYRRYSFKEFVLVVAARKMRDAEFSIQSMRSIIERLNAEIQNLSFPLTSAVILINRQRFYICKEQVIESDPDMVRLDCKELADRVRQTYALAA